MIALGIVCGIVLLILLLPVGIRIVLDDELQLYYTILGFSILSTPKEDSLTKKAIRKVYAETLQAGDIPSFGKYLLLLCRLLGRALKRARIRDLTVHAFVSGSDPHVNYGRAWAVIGSLMPVLDHHLRIQKRDVNVFFAEEAEEFRFFLRLHGVVPLFRVFHLLGFTLKGSFKIEFARQRKKGKAVKQ